MIEVRAYRVDDMGITERAGGVPTLRGLAVPYNKQSEDLGGFREVIALDAFREDVESGKAIAMLWQHDPAHPISKTTARVSPLLLANDARGITFEQEARSLTPEQRQRIEDGVVDTMSFGFRVRKAANETWQELTGGRYLRTVLKAELLEISPVTFASYRHTKVAVRNAHAAGITLPGFVESASGTAAMRDQVPDGLPAEVYLREQERRLDLALLGERG